MEANPDYKDIISTVESKLGVGVSYDVEKRVVDIFSGEISIYYLSGLSDNMQSIKIIESILAIPRDKEYSFALVKENISHLSLIVIDNLNTAYAEILSGMLVLIFEGYKEMLSVDVRNYPTRAIDEPDMEKVIRGAHDGFTENFNTNIALIRRRVRDTRLRNEIFKVGSASAATVCLSYIKGICSEVILESVRSKLKSVNVEHLIMADKELEELIIRKHFNPYPLVRYTERADTVSVHLYQGMFALFVDTSPSVILAPATFADHVQHAEEYRQTPLSGTYLRFVRYFGIFLSLFLTPLWLIFIKSNLLTGMAAILIPDNTILINIYIQILIAEIGVEFLRMASIHTPNALSTAMGLIAGVLLGDIAVSVGLFAVQTVLLVAVSAIGTYVTPSYELGLANKLSKLFFIVAVMLGGYIGFIAAVVIWLTYLSTLKSVGKPYLYPLIPLNFKRLLKVFIRYPYKNKQNGGKQCQD